MKQRPLDIHSNDNTLFTTEQCNNHCIMCCQPPRKIDDIDHYYQQNIKRVLSAPKDLPLIALTGGEPTLMGDKLFSLIRLIREQLPKTEIHILSNGRKFIDPEYAKALKQAGDNKVMVGVPLHSDYEKDHDIIAGSKGAYNETILGLYNLAMQGIAIELRIVMNKLNYMRLPQMASFIHKNLSFVTWTAFMGMERVGFADTKSTHILSHNYAKRCNCSMTSDMKWSSSIFRFAYYRNNIILTQRKVFLIGKTNIPTAVNSADSKNNVAGSLQPQLNYTSE